MNVADMREYLKVYPDHYTLTIYDLRTGIPHDLQDVDFIGDSTLACQFESAEPKELRQYGKRQTERRPKTIGGATAARR